MPGRSTAPTPPRNPKTKPSKGFGKGEPTEGLGAGGRGARHGRHRPGTWRPSYNTEQPRATRKGKTTSNAYLREKADATDRELRRKALERGIGRTIDPLASAAAPGMAGQIFRGVAGSLLPGAGIAKTLKGEDAAAWELGLDAALFWLPGIKGAPTATTAAIRAARGFGKGKPLKESLNEPVRPIRSLKLGEKTQQLQGASSRVTRNVIEKPADAVSKAMMGEGKVARAARKVERWPGMPKPSAESRVTRHAAREADQEARRAAASMKRFTRVLPKKGSPEDVAHFWWAQIPRALRNVKGLQLVRAKLAENLEEIASGRAFAQLEPRKKNLETALAVAKGQPDPSDTKIAHLEGKLAKIERLISDLKPRGEDLGLAIAQLDGIIASPPRLDPQIIQAVKALSDDHRKVLEAAGVLIPAKADARQGLTSRWLGLAEDGDELYIGHRLGKVRGANPSLMPVSVGVGKVRLPQGVSQANKLVLASTGRLRPTTHVAAEDWEAAQVFRQGLSARDFFGQVGDDFKMQLSKDEYLINRNGEVVPPSWKTNKLAELADQGYPEEALEDAAREIVRGFMVTADDDWEAMAKAWLDKGVKLDDLRVVPKHVVERYYRTFMPAGGRTIGGKAYDITVDFTAASIVFARIGYVPKAWVQNLVLTIPHQGIYFAFNAPRAVQILRHPILKDLFEAEVQGGATAALAQEARFAGKIKGAPGKAAEKVTAVADTPFRIAALIHELAKEGVIPKYKAHFDPDELDRVLDFFTNQAHRPRLNDVGSRGREAMADFSRMNPTQRRWARRFFVIPGWLWAGSRYPIHFAATHPGRSAALAYVGAGEPGAPEELQFNKSFDKYFLEDLPEFVEGIPLLGGVLRSNSLTPVGTPVDVTKAVAQRDFRTVGDYASPPAVAAWNIANRTATGRNGPYRTDFLTALRKNIERVVPNAKFVQDMIDPPDDPFYPGDKTRWGRFARELGVVPIEVPREVPVGEKAASKVRERRATFEAEIEKANIPPNLVRASRKAWGLQEKLNVARAEIDSELEGIDYQREALRVEFALARRNGLRPVGGERAQAYFAASPAARKKIAENWTEENLSKLRREISYYAFGGRTIRHVREAAKP